MQNLKSKGEIKMRKQECTHRRVKKNYSFGKNSTATKVCKDCGKVIKPYDIRKAEEKRVKENFWRR